eukprot:Skav201850  [mRNA]  locus=scaffold484:325974:327190:- [translate_table: standard]
MGQTMEARFRMNCAADPCQLDIEVLPKGTSCPPPAIPYIFKFENGSLHLCGPADGRMHRATNFEGPGLCIMEKIEKVSVRNPSKASQLSMSYEPDPEFSRNTTESVKDQPIKTPLLIKESTAPKQSKNMFGWIEEQPAMAASMALALTSTIIALRKSI